MIGVLIGNEFNEESNFNILEIVLKVKVQGVGEAGWLARVVEVTEDDSEAQ